MNMQKSDKIALFEAALVALRDPFFVAVLAERMDISDEEAQRLEAVAADFMECVPPVGDRAQKPAMSLEMMYLHESLHELSDRLGGTDGDIVKKANDAIYDLESDLMSLAASLCCAGKKIDELLSRTGELPPSEGSSPEESGR